MFKQYQHIDNFNAMIYHLAQFFPTFSGAAIPRNQNMRYFIEVESMVAFNKGQQRIVMYFFLNLNVSHFDCIQFSRIFQFQLWNFMEFYFYLRKKNSFYILF